MSRYRAEFLGSQDRSGFNSGNDRINRYFHEQVGQDVKRRYAACRVLIDIESGTIAGFHTLSSVGIALTEVPTDIILRLPRYPTVPAVLIGWLGRDMAFQGRNVGPLLLFDAIAQVATAPVGAHAILADALDDKAEAFYQRHVFIKTGSAARRLFLSMATAQALITD